MRNLTTLAVIVVVSGTVGTASGNQQPAARPAVSSPQAGASAVSSPAPGITPPADYVIGSDDVLSVVFWRDKEMSADVIVRPDGKISLPLINDVHAAGLTPDQLRQSLETVAQRFIEDPNAAVIVKEIKSRKVFITGQVTRPGTYPLTGPTTVLQLIAIAGGLLEYADAKNIAVMRTENGRPVSLKFNYKDVVRRKNVQQNVPLRPGDTIVVP